MKFHKLVLLVCLFLARTSIAQSTSDYFTIEGDVTSGVQINGSKLKTYPVTTLDSLRIFTHDMQPKSLMKNIKGVLLKDILAVISFKNENPKVLSAYYIECVATDGYIVLFSWNEIFNTEIGNHVMIITEKNGTDFTGQDDRMALISPTDKATGRRYVKWLTKIIIQRVGK